MTVAEYRKNLERNGSLEMYKFIEPAREIWSNSACVGYAIIAAQDAQLKPEQIERLVPCLASLLDRSPLEDAAASSGKTEDLYYAEKGGKRG